MSNEEIRKLIIEALNNELWENENAEYGYEQANKQLVDRLIGIIEKIKKEQHG
jgi:hypothetical protein